MMEPRASIIIPVFEQAFYSRLALSSLELSDHADVEIIVVDNASADDTPKMLEEWSARNPRHRYLRLSTNRGFAAASNHGAEAARAPILVFLNNDTFMTGDWLQRLCSPLQDPTVSVAGCRLLYPNGTVQHGGVAFGPAGPLHIFAGLPGNHPAVTRRREWQAVTGAAMAMRRKDFVSLNGFELAYANCYEDIDLCLRARDTGGKVLYEPAAVGYHFESMTAGRVGANEIASRQTFLTRWRGKYREDLETELRSAAASGLDLTPAIPPKWQLEREQKAQSAALQESVVRLQEEVAHLHKLLANGHAALSDARLHLDLRSVRLALRAQRWLRRLVPPPDVSPPPAPESDDAANERETTRQPGGVAAWTDGV
jgi:GT2 family glycosyltransferase